MAYPNAEDDPLFPGGPTPQPPPPPPPPEPPPTPPPVAPPRSLAELADPYTGGASASRRAPRLVNRNGQWVLTEHDNERLLQENEVESAADYVRRFSAANPTGFQAGVGAQTNEAYGTPQQARFNASLGQNPGARFQGSPYASQGFNYGRDQDVTKSAKDAFLHATSLGAQAGAGNQWHTKEGAQQFATLYVKPYLESMGYKVLGINGDLINIVTREDEAAGNTAGSWFDFVVGAGGANPELAWQIQSGTGAEQATPAQGSTGQTYRGLFEGIVAGRTPSLQTLQEIAPLLERYGMRLEYNANRTGADIRLPNGQIIDVVQNMAGQGPRAWQWLGGDYPYTAPITGIVPPTTGGGTGTGGTGTGGGTTGGGTGTTPPAAGPAATDYRAQFNQIMGTAKANVVALRDKAYDLGKAGMRLTVNPDGSAKLTLPDGKVVTVFKPGQTADRAVWSWE